MFHIYFSDFVYSDAEYLLLSGAPFLDPKYYPEYLNLKDARWTEEDRNMSQCLMEAWANFAKEGYHIIYIFNKFNLCISI